MPLEWKDQTSYSAGERGNVQPRIWETRVEFLRIVVHRKVGLDGWFGTCHTLSVKDRPLDGINADEAKVEFVRFLAGLTKSWAAALDRAEPRLCAACGNPESPHAFRHPFRAKKL
jgi:hypothetical protein